MRRQQRRDTAAEASVMYERAIEAITTAEDYDAEGMTECCADEHRAAQTYLLASIALRLQLLDQTP